MSKIYEALLRAEKDRAEGIIDKAPNPDTAQQPAPAVSQALAAVVDLPSEPVFAEPNIEAPKPEPSYSAPEPVYVAPAPKAPAPAAPAPQAAYPAPHPAPDPTPIPPAYQASRPIQPPAAPVPVPTTQLARVGDAFDPARVAFHTWEPAFSQLPALQERGAQVEQFRSLRSRMFEFRDLNKLKSIMVSSGLPQEGKSFITANLAVSFAKHKASRVLLIDGDMRRSTLHKMLGAPNDLGLSDYLASKASILDIMQRQDPGTGEIPLHAGLASLTFISGGTESDKAADLSGNRRFDHLIATLSPFFDWIVVDSSPVNLVADAVNLSRACDGVLLVARGGITKYQAAQRALGELKASRILGVVLNAVHNPPTPGGYYGYDGYDGYDAETPELPEKKEPELSLR